jgi:hypothetical protein
MPLYKWLGNRILSATQRRLTGLQISEFHSGYRLYSGRLLRQVPFASFTDEWHFDTQILLGAHERKLQIAEVPIPTYYGDEICHVNGIPYAMNCIAASVRYWWIHRRGQLAFPGPADVPAPSPVVAVSPPPAPLPAPVPVPAPTEASAR